MIFFPCHFEKSSSISKFYLQNPVGYIEEDSPDPSEDHDTKMGLYCKHIIFNIKIIFKIGPTYGPINIKK